MKFEDIPQFTKSGSYQVDIPLEYFAEYIDKEVEQNGLQLNPDFQRGNVWTREQQIAYIEYFLKGGRSGNIVYFNNPQWYCHSKCLDYSDYVCVDGLQRITTLTGFLKNEIPAFGTYYNDFEDKPALMTTFIKVNINDLKSKKEVLTWYLEMNTGGTVHSKEEISKVQGMIAEIDKKTSFIDPYLLKVAETYLSLFPKNYPLEYTKQQVSEKMRMINDCPDSQLLKPAHFLKCLYKPEETILRSLSEYEKRDLPNKPNEKDNLDVER